MIINITPVTKHNPEVPNIAKEQDYIILNSVANLSKAIDLISDYKAKYCYPDNDKACRETWFTISDRCGYRVSDQSVYYKEYKDLNDYLCVEKTASRNKKK